MSDETATSETETLVPATPEAEMLTPAAGALRARVRFGAICWGIVAALVGTLTLSLAATPARRSGVIDWLQRLTPGGMAVIAVLVLGTLLLLLGVLAALRRASRRRLSRLSQEQSLPTVRRE